MDLWILFLCYKGILYIKVSVSNMFEITVILSKLLY